MAEKDMVNVKQLINGYPFSIEWLLESLRNNDMDFQRLHGNRGIKEVIACDVSKGKGFASEILRCTLIFTDPKISNFTNNFYTTILKIPGLASFKETCLKSGGGVEEFDGTEILKKIAEVHNCECEFYSNLSPLFLDVPIPKVFKTLKWNFETTNQHGCIHMEDLSQKAKTLLYFESVNLTQIKNMIRILARMHKNILIVDPKKWQGKYLKNQTIQMDNIIKIKPLMEAFLNKSKRKSGELKDSEKKSNLIIFLVDFQPLMDKYQKISESKEFYTYVFKQSYRGLGIKPVIVHGDMFPGNIMWSVNEENGEIQNTLGAIVDWQIFHEGSPMADLAHFLTFCADGIVRRQAENFAIDFYLECLLTEFGGDSSKIPYTKIQLQKAYNLAFIIHAFALAGVPIFFLAAIEEIEPNQNIKNAYFDNSVLKALHAYEDADRLLQNEMKDFFEKYGK